MKRLPWVISGLCVGLASAVASASQIAPLGSSFEAALTNEPEHNLAAIADRLGRVIKSPVHEEITQLAFDCTAKLSNLGTDKLCAEKDLPFVTPFVIYGVRWNDLPPFRLSKREGAGCKKFFPRTPACNTDQTIRFSTQPECWGCLFSSASKVAETKKIVGCMKGDGYVPGNLMTRSHFGDLQFLHAMATADGISAEVTQREVLEWLEFAWKVFSKEIAPSTYLRTIPITIIQSRFGCSSWRVQDLYVLGRTEKLLKHLPHIAFGSVLHVVQDSFSAAHVSREPAARGATCEAGGRTFKRPGRIKQFYTYAGQDGQKHDGEDTREAMVSKVLGGGAEGVAMSKELVALYQDRMKWEVAEPYMRCIFELADEPLPSAPGDDFRLSEQ